MLSKQNKSNNSKCLASSALLHLFFTSNSTAFVGGGATIFITHECKVP